MEADRQEEREAREARRQRLARAIGTIVLGSTVEMSRDQAR